MAELLKKLTEQEQKEFIESLEITEMEEPTDLTEIKEQVKDKKKEFILKFGK